MTRQEPPGSITEGVRGVEGHLFSVPRADFLSFRRGTSMTPNEYDRAINKLTDGFRDLLSQSFVNGLERDEVIERGKAALGWLENDLFASVAGR